MIDGRDAPHYDESLIATALHKLPVLRRVIFACSCAERLMPTYGWLCEQRSQSSSFMIVREALDVACSVSSSAAVSPATQQLLIWRKRIENLIPDDQGEYGVPGFAFAQNAVAAVAYALRTWETGEPQEAVWAARQLYEAADVVVQQGAPVGGYIEDIDSTAAVTFMVNGIYTVLRSLSTGSNAPWQPSNAKTDGEAFLVYVKEALGA